MLNVKPTTLRLVSLATYRRSELRVEVDKGVTFNGVLIQWF